MAGFWRWCVCLAMPGVVLCAPLAAQDAAPVEPPVPTPATQAELPPELAAHAQVYVDRMVPVAASEFARTAIVLNHETGLLLAPSDVATSLTPVDLVPPQGEAVEQYVFTTRHTQSTPPMLCAFTPDWPAGTLTADLRDVPISKGVRDGDAAYLISMERLPDGTRRSHCETVTVTKMRHNYPQIKRQVVVFNAVRQDRHLGGVLMDSDGALLGIVFEEPTDVQNLGYAMPVLLPDGLATAAAEGKENIRKPNAPRYLHKDIADYDWLTVAAESDMELTVREGLANQRWRATEQSIEWGPLVVAHDPAVAQTWFDLGWRLYAVWSLSPPNLRALKPRMRLCFEEAMRLDPELTPLMYAALAAILADDDDMDAARAMATAGTTRWPGGAPLCYYVLARITDLEATPDEADAKDENATETEPTPPVDPVLSAMYHDGYMRHVPATGPATWWQAHWARLEALEPAQLTALITRLRADGGPVTTSPAERVAAARRAVATPGGWADWETLVPLAADATETGRLGIPTAVLAPTDLALQDVRQLLLDDAGAAIFAVTGSGELIKLDARSHAEQARVTLPSGIGALVAAGSAIAALETETGIIHTWRMTDLSAGTAYQFDEFSLELVQLTPSARSGMIGVSAAVGRNARRGLLDLTRDEAFMIPAPIAGWPATERLWLAPEGLANRNTLTDLYTMQTERVTSRTDGSLPILPDALRLWPQYFARDVHSSVRSVTPLHADHTRGVAIVARPGTDQLAVKALDLASGRPLWQVLISGRPHDSQTLVPATMRLYLYGSDRPLSVVQLGPVQRGADDAVLRIGSATEPVFPATVRVGVPIQIHVATPVAGATFALQDAPAGVAIAADGTVTWTPDVTQLGLYAITVITRHHEQEERHKWLVRIGL